MGGGEVPSLCVGGEVGEIPIPAVIKPRISSGSFGIVYVKKEEDLVPFLSETCPRTIFFFHIVQESVPDGGVAFSPFIF